MGEFRGVGGRGGGVGVGVEEGGGLCCSGVVLCWCYFEGRTCVEDSLGQDGAELGHDVVVLVVDDLGVELPELVDLGQRGQQGEAGQHKHWWRCWCVGIVSYFIKGQK